MPKASNVPTPAPGSDTPTHADIKAAQAGNADALSKIKRAVSADAHVRSVFTDFAYQTRLQLVFATASVGNDHLIRDMLLDYKLPDLQRTLEAEAGSSALEKNLIERVVTTWLAANLADTEGAHIRNQGATLAKAEYYDRRSQRANREYLRAVEALARVRRLLRPEIHLSIQPPAMVAPSEYVVDERAIPDGHG